MSADQLTTLYAGFRDRLRSTPDMGLDAMRDLFEGWHQGTAEPETVRYAEAVGAPVPGTWCRGDDARPANVVVYTHGGGFVVGSRHSHRKLAGHLAARSGVPTLVIDYRRAPEHPFPAAIEDTEAVVDWLVGRGYRPQDVVLAGDSAGGNIAIGTALRMVGRGAAPGAVVALSPWLDLANTGRSLEENATFDAMVDRPMLEIMAGLYLGAEPAVAPHVNPLHADPSGLPPVFLTASRHETLRDDAVRFAERVRAAGGAATLELTDRQQHVFQMGAGRSATADESLVGIGRWLGSVLAPSLAGGAR